jgi:DNA repair protein RecN (Recombination protein N)
MLAVKSILATQSKLPTIVFDEIDTGVSGDIAQKMGDILQKMGLSMQVIAITHLPQIAGKGSKHFKIFKEDIGETTVTKIEELATEDRIVELAMMLGGNTKSESAMAHAKALLN